MEEGNSIIYGLEHQTRALSPQYGEGDTVRFVIGTQSLKPGANQIHVVELEEDTGALHTKVYRHEPGEIWHVRCSPHDAATLVTTHNAYDAAAQQCYMGVSVFKLPTLQVIPKDLDELSAMQGRAAEDMQVLLTIQPEKAEEEIRCAEWHPTDSGRLGVVCAGSVGLHDLNAGGAEAGRLRPDTRQRLKLTTGKWNPHQGHCQFAVLADTHVRCYDTRVGAASSSTKPAWSVEHAHSQLARDLDFNPNRQFQLATVGDDAALNIWDIRHSNQPVFSRTDHSHWVWTVRYNTYHEQLLLTGSSDARALLTAAASVCRDTDTDTDTDGDNHTLLEDGVLQSYEQHEDSVYCCEWSAAEPWAFASLSYDARLVISAVPKHFKYKLLL